MVDKEWLFLASQEFLTDREKEPDINMTEGRAETGGIRYTNQKTLSPVSPKTPPNTLSGSQT